MHRLSVNGWLCLVSRVATHRWEVRLYYSDTEFFCHRGSRRFVTGYLESKGRNLVKWMRFDAI